MQLSDGRGIKSPYWIANELVDHRDFNSLHDVAYKNAIDMIAAILAAPEADGSSADMVVGDGLRMVWSSGMTAYLHPGFALSFKGSYTSGSSWGFVESSGDIFGVFVDAPTSVTVDEGLVGSNRYDTIQIRPVQTFYDEQTRKFRDPLTEVITEADVNVRVKYSFEVQVLKGVGGGSAPAKTSGWIKVAEVYIPSSATTLSQASYKDADVIGTWSTSNNLWTTEADITTRKGAIAPTYATVNTSSANLSVNQMTFVDYTEQTTLTLPSAAHVGDLIHIVNVGGGGFKIAQPSGQYIIDGGRVSRIGTSGYAYSRRRYSSLKMICVVENTAWQIIETTDTRNMRAYAMGGYCIDGDLLVARNSQIYSFDFLTETLGITVSACWASTMYGCGLSGHLKGYRCGGAWSAGDNTHTTESMTFATAVAAYASATLSSARAEGAGAVSSIKGYIMGGMTNSSTTAVIDAFVFSAETCAAISDSLDTARASTCGVYTGLHGYAMSGLGGSGYLKTTDRLTYATEAAAAITSQLSSFYERRYATPLQTTDFGLMVGGQTAESGATDVISSLAFATETVTSVAAAYAEGTQEASGASGPLHGYLFGTRNWSSGSVHEIGRVTFSTLANEVLEYTLSSLIGAYGPFMGSTAVYGHSG